MANWIKDLVDQKRADNAKQRALALIALGDVNPTEEELLAFTPGKSIDPLAGVTGSTATPGLEGVPDPALAADLQTELRNEEMARVIKQNAPAVTALRQSQALADAGINENALAQTRLTNIQADDQDARGRVVRDAIDNPDTHPLLRLDIAQKNSTFKPQLVKVRRRDGTEVYMNQTPTLSGESVFTPAVNEDDEPLQLPQKAVGAGKAKGAAPTALQKNAGYVAKLLFPGDPDGESKAVEQLMRLKAKNPQEAWSSVVSKASTLNYGRYARDPQQLYAKSAELWRVMRPGEPVPALEEARASAPTARPSATPASDNDYRTPEDVKAAYKAGRLSKADAARRLQGMGFE